MLNGIQLRCLNKDEAEEVMREIHVGVCGFHMNDIILAKKIVWQGYYWLSIEKDCIQTVRQYHQCQIHGNLNHLPPIMFNSLSSPWPFVAWGIDIIGEIRPNASNGHKYIVVAIDYFSRWIEVESFATWKLNRWQGSLRRVSSIDMGFLITLWQIMVFSFRLRQQNCYRDMVSSIISLHRIDLRQMEQLKQLTRT